MNKKAIVLMNHMKSSTEYTVEFDEGFSDRASAIAWVNCFKVTPYQDNEGGNNDYGFAPTYNKSFAKGSPLEWMNPLSDSQMQGQLSLGQGIIEIEEKMVPIWVRIS